MRNGCNKTAKWFEGATQPWPGLCKAPPIFAIGLAIVFDSLWLDHAHCIGKRRLVKRGLCLSQFKTKIYNPLMLRPTTEFKAVRPRFEYIAVRLTVRVWLAS